MCTNPIYEKDGEVSILLDNVNSEGSKCTISNKNFGKPLDSSLRALAIKKAVLPGKERKI
jgi:hypothetical protein